MTQAQVNEYGKIERKISNLHNSLSQEVGSSTMDMIKDLVALELELIKIKFNYDL